MTDVAAAAATGENLSATLQGDHQAPIDAPAAPKHLHVHTSHIDSDDESQYPPEDIENDRLRDKGELTARALLVGGAVGILIASININLGLRTGWTQGGTVFAAILGIGIFKLINPVIKFSKYEAVIASTVASAAGTMASAAGLVSAIPALKLLGMSYSVVELYLYAFSVAFLGIYFAVPLRRQIIVIEKLRYPSGTATAATINALYMKASNTVSRASVLMYTAIVTGLYSVLSFFIPWFEEPPFPRAVADWGFNLYINPLMMGGGILSGPRSCFSLLTGAILGWGIIGPIVQSQKLVQGKPMSYDGARGWILWVGVAIMTADALVQLVFTLKYAVQGIIALVKRVRAYGKKRQRQKQLKRRAAAPAPSAPQSQSGDDNPYVLTRSEDDDEDTDRPLMQHEPQELHLQGQPEEDPHADEDEEEEEENRVASPYKSQSIPFLWAVIGLLISGVVLMIVEDTVFGLRFYYVLIAIPLGAVLSIIAVRCAGETDINPVGSMGKVTQLLFAAIAPGQVYTNLLAAGVVASGASQAGDMMQDLKAGFLLRVSPRKQFIAQSLGIIIGIIFVVPVYKLYDSAYHIGDESMPAPAAHAWKAVAQVLSKGLGALPLGSAWGILAGAIFGLVLGLANRIVGCISERAAYFVPSPLAIGIGMIVPPRQAVTMTIGCVIFLIWKRIKPEQANNYFFSVSSGLIAGEGIMSIFLALLKLVGLGSVVQPLWY